MFVQVVTFSLEGITEEGYLDVANNLAPRYAGLPGLLAKIWLENPGANRYGAVYFWEDAESMDRFGNSDLFEGDTAEFIEFVSEEFRVLENLTDQTQPALEILEPRRAVKAAPPVKKAAKAGSVPGVKEARAEKTVVGELATTPGRQTTAKKATAKKATAKKATAKKATAKKATAKKAAGTRAAGTRAAGKAAAAPPKKAGRKAPR